LAAFEVISDGVRAGSVTIMPDFVNYSGILISFGVEFPKRGGCL
jgi:hypothetical protein